MTASAEFVRRVEQRLERDRKRLQDYYRALSREADGSKRRAAAVPSPEEIAAKKRAVDLELRRKLAELNENYALRAELRPVVVAQGSSSGARSSRRDPAETSDRVTTVFTGTRC